MGLFRRRPRGRHAAPTGRVVPPAVAVPAWEQSGYTIAQQTEPTPGPRVELGFRDGSTAALAPDSVQARALTAIADVLARRD